MVHEEIFGKDSGAYRKNVSFSRALERDKQKQGNTQVVTLVGELLSC